jgi:predicted TIM-barrel fold metal-dependent hydrolase
LRNYFILHLSKFGSGFLASLVLAGCVTQAEPEIKVSGPSASVPIADVHMHIYGQKINGYSVDWFIERMNQENVRWGGGVGNYLPEASSKLQHRYIPAFGQREYFLAFRHEGTRVLTDPSNPRLKTMLMEARLLFKAGKIKGFGEIHTSNENSGPPNMRRYVRLNNKLVSAMLSIANEFNGFVQFHNEYDSNLENDVRYLAKKYPKASIILSHCVPGSTPAQLERILTTSNNVYCEISGQNGPAISEEIRRAVSRWGFGCGRIYCTSGIDEDWKQLIEKHPDKFMVGSDPCCSYTRKFPRIIREIRQYFLASLSEPTMKKVAYENAVRVFRLENLANQ